MLCLFISPSITASITTPLTRSEIKYEGYIELENIKYYSFHIKKNLDTGNIEILDFNFDGKNFAVPNLNEITDADLNGIQLFYNGGLRIGGETPYNSPSTILLQIPFGSEVECQKEFYLDYDYKYLMYYFTLDSKFYKKEITQACSE